MKHACALGVSEPNTSELNSGSLSIHIATCTWGLVSQTTPFAERGRVWSHCNYRVVTEERNYQT